MIDAGKEAKHVFVSTVQASGLSWSENEMTKTITQFEEVVKASDKRETAGKIYTPKAWIGKKVIVYLKE